MKRSEGFTMGLTITLIVGLLVLLVLIPAIGILYRTVVTTPNFLTKLTFKLAYFIRVAYPISSAIVDWAERSFACPQAILQAKPYTRWYDSRSNYLDIVANLDKDVITVLINEGYLPKLGEKLPGDKEKKYYILTVNYLVAKYIATAYSEVEGGWTAGHDDVRRIICLAYPNFELEGDDVVIDEALVSALLASFKNEYCPRKIQNYVDLDNSKYSDLVNKILQKLREKGKDVDKCVNGEDMIKFVNSENDKYVFRKKDDLVAVKYWDDIAKETAFFRKYFEPRYLCVFIGIDDPDITYPKPRVVARGYYIVRYKETTIRDIVGSLRGMLGDGALACYYEHIFPCAKWGPGTPQPFFVAYDFDDTPDTAGPLNNYLDSYTIKKYAAPEIIDAVKQELEETGLTTDVCTLEGEENFRYCGKDLLIIKIKDYADQSESDVTLRDYEIPKTVSNYIKYLTNKYPELDSSIVYYMLYVNKNEKWNLVLIHPFAILSKSVDVSAGNPLYYKMESGEEIRSWIASIIKDDAHPDYGDISEVLPVEIFYMCRYDYELENYNCYLADVSYIWDDMFYKITWG